MGRSLKEVQSSALEVANKFTSRTRIIEDSDVDADFEQVLFELAEEEMLMTELGMDTAPAVGKVTPERPTTPADEGDPPADNTSQPASKALATKGENQMTSREILSLILAAKGESSTGAITVNVPPPIVNIAELKMPEQKAPVVNVTPTAIKPPDVIVNVAAPAVKIENTVKVPRTKKMTIKRGDDGKMSEMQAEYDDGI